ncbi:PREDICTED: probable purine permease 6 [Tarenaya hassleriana]|uniref:probable purine permease 6 n=1 Tax=Tarenaya hassleriana TaxID=28532 RepID=UPI0008FD4A67|nr:PREDICTED: probable purine permease 6 [Tarenaya hassleriana]
MHTHTYIYTHTHITINRGKTSSLVPSPFAPVWSMFVSSRMGKEAALELQLHINGESEHNSKGIGGVSNKIIGEMEKKGHTYLWWFRVSLYVILLLAGQTIATLLGRLYYDKGGNGKWLETLVQLVGFPLLLPCYLYTNPKHGTETETETEEASSSSRSCSLTLVSVYVVLGLIVAGDSVLYSLGLLYLPVSTFSLISASQLAFNAVFSYFLNSQRFTPFVINSIVLLTISSVLLVLQPERGVSSSSQSSRSNHMVGFIYTIGSSAGYSLTLSLTDLAFDKILKKRTFRAILDMVIYQSLVATCAVMAGLFWSGEWKTLSAEMGQFRLGKASYFMIIAGASVSWQAFSVGSVGLILEVSSLFSNVISTLGLPVVPVVAMVFFHDEMSGIKLVSMLLAFWGFVSYAYHQYLDDQNA